MGYLKREGNLDELLKKSPAQIESFLSAHLNVILEIDNIDTSKQENQINLFNENPEVKHIYEGVIIQTSNSDTLKKYILLTRQGEEGDFPTGPTESVKSTLPNKPRKPKKLPKFNVFPDSIFPYKTLSLSDILNKKAQQDYRKDYQAYEKHIKKFKRIMTRNIMLIKRS